MIEKATELLTAMADQLPGLVVTAAVHLEDGLPIAEVTRKDGLDAGASSAYLATIVQSNLQAIKALAQDQITDDILITTDQYFFLIRHAPGSPYFLFVMTLRDEWLGRARLIMKEFNQELEKILG